MSASNSTQQASGFPALWAGYINNGQLDKVIALYNENAVLMPTFSPNPVTDTQGLTNYFTNLASKKGLNVKLEEETVVCLHIEAQSYVINGDYAFAFQQDGALQTFPSRFTFVIDLAKEQPILHHHSSQLPTPLG